MPSITIDAGVLASPDMECSKDEVFAYIDTLQDWKKLLDDKWISIYMSEKAAETLQSDGLYPLRQQLKELFVYHAIKEYSVNDVAVIIERLLTITPTFETYFHLKDILMDNLEVTPNILQFITYSGLHSDLARCIVLVAILRAHCEQPIGGHQYFLKSAPCKSIKVRANIIYLEHERAIPLLLPEPSEFFEGNVLICDNFNGLIDSIDDGEIFAKSAGDEGISLAIRIAHYKCSKAIEFDEIIIPKIGNEFRILSQELCASGDPDLPTRILRSIIETNLGIQLSAVHPLRTGSGGGNPQIMRGKDKAQRRDIDYEYHLHYWECPNSVIELASVVHHNDFTIPF